MRRVPPASPLERAVCLGGALVCGGLLGASAPSRALSTYVQAVPFGSTLQCAGCHLSAGGGEGWNPFGQSILVAGGARPEVNTVDQNDGFELDATAFWTSVCATDSDGDGATNGEELGDPGCVWSVGDDDPAEALPGHPGDPADAPGGRADDTGDKDADQGDSGVAEPGGCSAAAVEPTVALALVAALLLAGRSRPPGDRVTSARSSGSACAGGPSRD